MTIKIGILNCYDESKAVFTYGDKLVNEAELLSLRITSLSKNVSTETFNVTYDEFPKKDLDAYVISGSYYNPDRDSIVNNKWMKTLLSFIRSAHEKKIPLFGICFGHQMIAVALGAKVFELPETEVGFKRLKIEEQGKKSPLFKSIADSFFAVFFHKWAVYKNSLPFGSKILTSCPVIPDQAAAFSIGETTYAVQFHPERVSTDVKVMFDTRQHMIFGKRRFNYSESSDANVKVLENFVKIISKKKK